MYVQKKYISNYKKYFQNIVMPIFVKYAYILQI